MALDPLVHADLKNVLECQNTQLEWGLDVRSNYQELYSMHGARNLVQTGNTSADLRLTFYVDQMAALSKEDIFTQLEHRIGEMCHFVDGVFLNRNVQPFDNVKAAKVSYTIKLADIDLFVEQLRKLAAKKLDRDFTKVLEATLQKD